MHIRSAPIDRALAEEDVQRHTRVLDRLRADLAEGDTNLLGATELAIRRAALLVALRPDDPMIRDDVRLVARAMAGFFALARAKGGPVDVAVVDDRAVRYEEPRVVWGAVEPYRWMQGWYAALLVDDVPSLALLASTPVALMRESSEPAPEFAYELVEALGALWNRAPGAVDRMLDALRAVPPDDDAALRLHAPPADLLLGVVQRDAARFDRDYARALEREREFWTLPNVIATQERLFAYRSAAAARRAVLAGLAVTVTADTVPDALVRAPRRDDVFGCCPYCVTPIGDGASRCPACLEDPSKDAAFEATADEYESAERRSCLTCDYPMLHFAVRCPRCRTRVGA